MRTLARDIVSRALHETETPIGLDAAAYPGASVLGDDGRVYTSIRWPTDSDPYSWQSAAAVAEDVAADVPRILTAEKKIVVDRTTPEVEGETYQTLNAALAYASRFTNDHGATQTERKRLWIEIASGWTAQEQVILNGVDLSNVTITAVDEVVTVEAAYLAIATSTESNVGDEIVHDFFYAERSNCPTIGGVIFRLDGGTVPQDADKVAEVGSYTPLSRGLYHDLGVALITLRDEDFDGAAITARPGGFEQFDFNARNEATGDLFLDGASLNDAVEDGLRNEGVMRIRGSTITGCGRSSIRQNGTMLITGQGSGDGAVFAGVYTQDFRKTAGADSSNDISIGGGGRLRINGLDVRGGLSVTPNVWSVDGYASDVRAAEESVSRSGAETLSNKTLASPVITGSISGDGIVGTVSQSGGNPTGALIEQGSNSNGDYVRFADGTQICWTGFNMSSNNPSTWTFPAVFSATPSVQGTATGNFPRMVVAANVSTTSVEFWVYKTDDNTSATTHTRLAIGRWF